MEPDVINENEEPEKPGLLKSAMTYGLYYAIIGTIGAIFTKKQSPDAIFN
jgi:hypothetical protein